MITKPMVSVIMITYGHEQFIKQAIEGVLMQQCDFEVELIIANDCSPDNTDSVVNQIIENHPNSNWIRYTRHTSNKGMTPNFVWALKQANGTYIALCEGDDYWTDPLKLKKQVDFLSANQEFGICFHKTEEINLFDKSKNRIFPNINNNTIYSIEDYILNNWTATCSIVFTYKFYKNENWYTTLPFGDLGLVLIILKNSNKKAMVFNDIMSVYRVHIGGVHGNLQQNCLKLIDAYKQHLVFGKIIKEKLLHERIYSKYFLKKKIQTYEKLNQLYKKEDFYIKMLSNKIIIFLLKIRYKLLYS
ncbi:MAG: glycosyltransferase [Flavobacterium sp.]|nr:glycosyltransferase [Flavobacterium sp.]